MKKSVLLGIIIILVILGAGLLRSRPQPVNSFADCTRVGGTIMESYPRQCTYAGTTYAETRITGTPVSEAPERIIMKQYDKPPTMTIGVNKQYTAVLDTSKGKIRIGLLPKDTPVAVNNFVFLTREGFYDNTPFHRIMKGFMIQGGDPTGTGTGGPGYHFTDEPITREYTRGTVAMANAGANTNGSQFFIMHEDYALPKNYVIFGQVTDADSLKVVDAIATSPVGSNGLGEISTPKESITVKTAMIEEK